MNNEPAGNPVRSVNVRIKLAGSAVKTTSTANVNNKPVGLSHLPQDVPVSNSLVPAPPRAESPSVAARTSKHITKWSVSEVVDYIKTTDCYKFADDFVRQVRFSVMFKCVYSNESLTEQYFPVVLFIMLCKVVLTFESVDEILKCDHLNESY